MDQISAMSTRLISKIAEHEGIDPADMNPPLYEAIDLETMERVFDSASGNFRLKFTYDGYLITVENPGYVEISDQGADGEAGETPIERFSVE